MSKQIRKYELDAISQEVLDDLQQKQQKGQASLEKGTKYKQIKQQVDTIVSLQTQIEDIQERISRQRESVRKVLKTFNKNLHEGFELHHQTYGSKDKLSWNKGFDYHLRQKVEQKLAIALMSPDARERMSEVIQEVVNSLS